MTNFKLKSFDETMLTMYLWDNVENPKGVVQLVHGMSEYLARYDEFAKFLNKQGYIVLGDDHRAHGLTANDEMQIGKVDKNKDIFEYTLKDELFIIETFKTKYAKLPYYIFSHSYGSFITQRLIQKCPFHLNGVILCGSAYLKNTIDTFAGKVITSLRPKNSHAKLVEKVSFKQYNKKFKTGAWITRNEEIAKKYYLDKYCNKHFTNGFYHSLFKGMLGNYKKENIKNIPENLPIFIISGLDDPISKNGKRTEKLYKMYLKHNMTNVSLKLYKEARHELLNELNKDEIYNDILIFLNKNI